MTRFARSKGSKASNERTPEESTPWSVMKEQLDNSKKEREDAKHREKAEQQRLENYKNFLHDQKTAKRKAVWCDFPETEQNKKKDVSISLDETNISKTKKKKKKKSAKSADVESLSQDSSEESKKKISKVEIDVNSDAIKQEQQQCNVLKKGEKNITSSDRNSEDKFKNKKKNHEKFKKRNKFDSGKTSLDDRSFHLIINGKDIDLVKFDGFPIIKKDAERLTELRKNMYTKGIPKSEVERTIKLERRRAEKALARMKKEVCYNCRKGGHNLSDCPELKSKIPEEASGADGICFKCGSTEHRQFECRVQKGNDYKFASCFICKEQGHIARQCPDNPRGLYPNGGGCKLCGDVTHMKKDCPTLNKEKETPSTRLATLADDFGLEEVTSSERKIDSNETKPNKPKHIKF